MSTEKYGTPAPMVLAMIICDAIHQDPATKKSTILGTFSTINARQFPAIHRQLAVHIAMSNGHGKTRIRLTLVGPDESQPPLFSREGVIEFSDPRMVAEINFALVNITFPTPGEYRLQILGNDELLMERRLYVIGLPPSMSPGGHSPEQQS
ncbi:MAG TPA: hypothetical protein PKY77_21665 [Phycisphaerae bacterium]|nr:hypothetical protein [Phycisphaerae bacterium]HRY66455.1 hypothetical protein [Phycisphaerae bacterium]HSA25837.1 hypothetical protein [Phycisphaerae bacterium]